MDPPVYLQPGQVVRTTIEGIGELVNECVAEVRERALKGKRVSVDSTRGGCRHELAPRDRRSSCGALADGASSPGGESQPTAGFSPYELAATERGRRDLTIDELRSIAGSIGVDVDELLPDGCVGRRSPTS